MSVLAAIAAEFDAARLDDLDVRWIRMSGSAVPGSPVLVPIAPERLRVAAAADYGAGLVADLEAFERWREIVIHPRDIETLRREATTREAQLAFDGDARGLRSVWGLPLVV